MLQSFKERFPKQFVNVGIAEQNMTGLAAGLALEGKTVLTYSIANFNTLRCLEQIRNDVCYHQLHVIIVSVGFVSATDRWGFPIMRQKISASCGASPTLPYLAQGAYGKPSRQRLPRCGLPARTT